jgi:hypothetical protein
VIAVKRASFDLFAAIVGIFAVQIMILLDHFVLKRIRRGLKGSTAG